MRVLNHIGGSKCVVELNRPCENWALHYIDARAHHAYPGFSFIEVVRHGQVYHRETVRDAEAPEKIMELVRGARHGRL